MFLILIFLLALFNPILAISAPLEAKAERTVVKFGIYTSYKPTKVARRMNLALTVIAERSKTIEPSLIVFRTYEKAMDAILNGEVDIVRLGPVTWLLTTKINPEIVAVAQEVKKYQPHGHIIVPTYLNIYKLDDLKDLAKIRPISLGLGDDKSTTGNYMPKLFLQRHGLTAKSFSSIHHYDRHDALFKAVLLGEVDVGATAWAAIQKTNSSKLVRSIFTYRSPGKVWAGRPNLEQWIVDEVRTQLLAIKDPKALSGLKAKGFMRYSPVTYRNTGRAIASEHLFDE